MVKTRFIRSAITLLLMSILLNSCDKLILYHPNEVRLDEENKDLNKKNINRLQSESVKSSFRFVVMGDSKRFYDELEDFVGVMNRYNDVSFVLLNGDITDAGLNREYQLIGRKLRKLKMPFIGVIGNHDMLANGRLIFEQMFGPENFSFSYGDYKFICLNSNSSEQGNDGSIPDIPWLQQQLAAISDEQRVFVFSHVPPFNPDFDPALSEVYATTLAKSGKALYSIHGHQHRFSLAQPYGPPVYYLVVSSMNRRNFVMVNVNTDTTTIEQIFY
ncbi:MAG TPA: metallophosphoesterase [Chitinophagaceae bacterium]|nr:metallophosphoesterase [Chitinophagaceae bacterium]